MKRALTLLLGLTLFVFLFSPEALAQRKGKVTLTAELDEPVRGSEIETVLELNRNPGIDSVLMTVKFDTEKIEFVSARDTELLPQFDQSLDTEGGEVVLRWCTTEDRGTLTETGVLADLTFRVIDDALLTDTEIQIEINELFFDAVDEKGNAVPFETVGLKIPLICRHESQSKTVLEEPTFTESGRASVLCRDCRKEWEEEVFPVLTSRDGKTVASVRPGEYGDEDVKNLRTDYFFGGGYFEEAKALVGDEVIRVFRVSFIKNDEVFDPAGSDPVSLTVDFELPEGFVLYAIGEEGAKRVEADLKEGILTFPHENKTFVLVSDKVEPPPVTTTKKPVVTTSSEAIPTTTVSERDRARRVEWLHIGLGALAAAVFAAGAVFVLRGKDRF